MSLPRVQPIIPTWRKEPFDDPEWVFDFKYDGFRALSYVERGRCRFISRNGNVLSRFDALGGQLATELAIDDAILDGEVIVADETGRPQFYDLLRRKLAPAYVAFEFYGSTAPTSAHCRSARVSGSSPECSGGASNDQPGGGIGRRDRLGSQRPRIR